MRLRNFKLVQGSSEPGQNGNSSADQTLPDDAPLFDAYSKAVVVRRPCCCPRGGGA